jgi:hypothetical protein
VSHVLRHLLRGFLAVLAIAAILNVAAPALANHETISVDWQGGTYIHGNPFRTTVEIETTSNLTAHGASDNLNQTRYLIVFRDRILSQDMPVQVHNETRTVTISNVNRTAAYSRPLIEGYWHLTVEAFDADTMQMLAVNNAEKTIVVQPAIYEEIRRLSDNLEADFFWIQFGLIIAILGAIGAAFGGATIGAYFSRKAASELWRNSKQGVEGQKASSVTESSQDVARDIASLQEQTAASQRGAAESLKKSGELQVLLGLFKSLGDDEQSKARGRIFVVYCSVYGSDPSRTEARQDQLLRFYANIRDDVRAVERAFDEAGVLVLNNKVDRNLFFDLYASVVVRAFQALEVHVNHERSKNGSYGVWFEKLYNASIDYYKNELKSTPPTVYCK